MRARMRWNIDEDMQRPGSTPARPCTCSEPEYECERQNDRKTVCNVVGRIHPRGRFRPVIRIERADELTSDDKPRWIGEIERQIGSEARNQDAWIGTEQLAGDKEMGE